MGFARLLAYVEVKGDARVAQSFTVSGFGLGVWVGVQRRAFIAGSLDAERQRRLEERPGWAWDRRADKWEAGFARCVHYLDPHGDTRVPVSYIEHVHRLCDTRVR